MRHSDRLKDCSSGSFRDYVMSCVTKKSGLGPDYLWVSCCVRNAGSKSNRWSDVVFGEEAPKKQSGLGVYVIPRRHSDKH